MEGLTGDSTCDVAIVGGGVIGVALAADLAARDMRVTLFEKEDALARHQSGRNSGVIHAGYNQAPGTMKARLVVEGNREVRAYCRDRRLPLFEGGILVVARDGTEEATLRELESRGKANGVNVTLLTPAQARDVEPHATASLALHAPEGASFDAEAFVEALAADARRAGAEICLGQRVQTAVETDRHVEVRADGRGVTARFLVNAAGLHADRLAHSMGVGRGSRIIPFRGEYRILGAPKAEWVRSHVYPPPDLRFPFLGVHLSRSAKGVVKVGPGATLARGREAYGRFPFEASELIRNAAEASFWRMAMDRSFLRLARRELPKSLFPDAVAHETSRLMPGITPQDLTPGPVGIRAQLVDDNGQMVQDLRMERTRRSLHVLNAVSPALTCSLPFARQLAATVMEKAVTA